MNSKKTVFPCILFLFCVHILFSQNTYPHKINSIEKVGYISFDKKTDNPNFYLCDEKNIFEYYQVNPSYKEGLKSIQAYFKNHITALNELIKTDGYLTVRFIINCKGETDRFRASFVNKNYNKVKINSDLQSKLISLFKKMGQWNPGYFEGTYFDSYKHIIFKISNGKIEEIYP